jgi:hypothetical protein
MESEQWVIVGTQVSGWCCAADDPAEHSAHGWAIECSPVDGKSDDSSCALVHDDHDPVCIEDQ